MKKIFLLTGIMLLIALTTYSQPNKVPPFQMIKTDGKVFNAGDLPMGKPIVIIYFSIDCGDCELLLQNLLHRIEDFSKVSIAMITYSPVEHVKQFAAKYKLNDYSNIFIGTEGDYYFVRDYYTIQQFPFIALYNKNGDLLKIYNKKESLEDLVYAMKDL